MAKNMYSFRGILKALFLSDMALGDIRRYISVLVLSAIAGASGVTVASSLEISSIFLISVVMSFEIASRMHDSRVLYASLMFLIGMLSYKTWLLSLSVAWFTSVLLINFAITVYFRLEKEGKKVV